MVGPFGAAGDGQKWRHRADAHGGRQHYLGHTRTPPATSGVAERRREADASCETGASGDIEAATKQMELALLLDGRLRPQ